MVTDKGNVQEFGRKKAPLFFPRYLIINFVIVICVQICFKIPLTRFLPVLHINDAKTNVRRYFIFLPSCLFMDEP